MRIHFTGGHVSASTSTMLQTLAKLLEEKVVLRGIVRRVSASSVLVEVSGNDVELPLKGAPLTVGQLVEITKQDPETIALRVLADQPAILPETEPSRTMADVRQALVEMNVPPTSEAIMVAEGLLESGFPLQEPLIWSLLPWAEKGQLAEALLALKAKFPLKPGVLAMIHNLQKHDVGEPILKNVKDELPPDLQTLFAKPSLENRARWSNRLAEGKLFKALVRLLVEERFIESLSQSEHLFALPFVRDDELYAGWLRITRDSPQRKSHDEHGGEQVFRLELQVPTRSFGVVAAEVLVAGESLSVILSAEERFDDAELHLQELGEELRLAGWSVKELRVRGWGNA